MHGINSSFRPGFDVCVRLRVNSQRSSSFDLITVALHKPLCHKEVKDTDIYYPQSISHFPYSGVVKHTIKCVFFCL